MRSTRIVLVRHGHVDPRGTMCGWTDIPLTETGARQAAVLARIGLDVDGVYSSTLARARDTARAVADSVTCDPRLREIGCGRLEGWPFLDIRETFPALWAANEAQLDEDFRWPDGESYRELRSRCVTAISGIAVRHPGGRVAVVTHAGVITQLLGYLLGTSPARWSSFRVGNASITTIDWLGARGEVRSYDVRDHLAPDLQT
jgi:broad specificity phosphatase PhoE